MKSTELMIGDWVMYQGEPRQIENIGKEGRDEYLTEYDGEATLSGGTLCTLSEVAPIPITSYIISRNLVRPCPVKEPYFWSWFERNDEHTEVKYIRYYFNNKRLEAGSKDMTVKNSGLVFNGCVWNVHELQHALRVVGIEKEVLL